MCNSFVRQKPLSRSANFYDDVVVTAVIKVESFEAEDCRHDLHVPAQDALCFGYSSLLCRNILK